MIKSADFSHQNRKLEVRAVVEDNEVKVRVFEDGEPATRVIYSITIETDFDAKVTGFPLNLVDELMRVAEDDVKEGRVPLIGP
jgi:hypothetical protein